jgi:hypothetical protein
MKFALGIRRKAALSPGVHRNNDLAILDATLDQLANAGYRVDSIDESDVEAGDAIPQADLYLNMCQGLEANLRLLSLEQAGAAIVNRPSSALDCHRARLIERLESGNAPFASSIVVREGEDDRLARWLASEPVTNTVWMKRGDVHAEGPSDVQAVPRGELERVLASFFARSIESVVIQRHLEGPLLKFYGIKGGWFRWFSPLDAKEANQAVDFSTLDTEALGRAAASAAARLDLEIFGGDAIFVAPDKPILIDVNDWPSFARFRDEAAAAIAAHVQRASASRRAAEVLR